MDTIKKVTIHGRGIDINLSKIFSNKEHKFAVCYLDPNRTFSYRPCHSYPEACALLEQYNKRLNCLLMIDVDGNPLHYAPDKKTLPVEMQ